MMRIINKIYIWFKKVILNILGVIRDIINKDNEVKILVIETVRDGIKGIINIFSSGNNLIEIGIFGVCACVGLTLAGCHKQSINKVEPPKDEGASDDEN